MTHLVLVDHGPEIAIPDSFLHQLYFQPESCPTNVSLTGDFAVDGHGGPGHQNADSDLCGTRPGMVCFRGALFHVNDRIYQVLRYDNTTDEWEARWPD